MRTEITISQFNRAAYVAAAPSQASAIDAVNGMCVPLGREGTRGLIVSIKNTSAQPRNIILAGRAYHGEIPETITIPARAAVLLSGFDGHLHGGQGSVVLDFEPGFIGEIAAFRLLRRG